jgi:hypothetical protein
MPLSTISVISWRSVLLVEEIRVPEEKHRPAASHWQTWSHIKLYRVHLTLMIGTDSISSYKFNYHMIMTMATSQSPVMSKSIIEESIKKNIFLFILLSKYIEYVLSQHFLWNNLPCFSYHFLFKFKHVYFTDEEIHIFSKTSN